MISLVFASRSATLTDATDLVTTANNHGFSANNQIRFLTIVNTTGISTNTWYYVANNASLTANTFQLTASAGSAVLPLTTNGTGTIAIPISPIQTPKAITYKHTLTNLIKFSPVFNVAASSAKATLTNLIKFSPVFNVAASSAKARLTNLIAEVIKFSVVNTAVVSSAKARLTNLVKEMVSISSIQSVNVVSYIKPYWSTINPIITKISSVTNLPAVVSFIADERFTQFKILFSPINIANVGTSSIVRIPSIIKEFVGSAALTVKVVTWKLPDPRTTWANVTQQVKTLIQFWS